MDLGQKWCYTRTGCSCYILVFNKWACLNNVLNICFLKNAWIAGNVIIYYQSIIMTCIIQAKESTCEVCFPTPWPNFCVSAFNLKWLHKEKLEICSKKQWPVSINCKISDGKKINLSVTLWPTWRVISFLTKSKFIETTETAEEIKLTIEIIQLNFEICIYVGI